MDSNRERTRITGFFFIPKTFSKKRFQFYKFTIDKGYRSDYYSIMKALTLSRTSEKNNIHHSHLFKGNSRG